MLLSVIVPTYNRNDLLRKCLDLLSPAIQTIEASDYEVIVTDDSKDYGARDLVEKAYPWAYCVEGPKKGPAANRNSGAAQAKGEWLVFIDDDCLPEINILKEYQQAIYKNPEVLAFEGRIFVDIPQTSLIQEAPLNLKGGCFWSCNICISKELFNFLNGFDECFPYAAMEDVDFFYRLKQITNKYMFVYQAAVVHPWRINNNPFRVILNRYNSQLYFENKHPVIKNEMTAFFYFQTFLRFFRSAVKGAYKMRFSGFNTKVIIDFFQLYFAFRTLFHLDKNFRKK